MPKESRVEYVNVLVYHNGEKSVLRLPRVGRKAWSELRENSQRVWIRRRLRQLYPHRHIAEIHLPEDWSGIEYHGCDALTAGLPWHPKFSTRLPGSRMRRERR